VANINLRVPARPEFIGVVKSTTTSVIGLTELAFEAVENWHEGIVEAFSLVINHQPDQGEVQITFSIETASLTVKISGPTGSAADYMDKVVCKWGWDILNASLPGSTAEISPDGAITITLSSLVVASA